MVVCTVCVRVGAYVCVLFDEQAFSYNNQAHTIRTKDSSKEKEIGKVYMKELSFSDVKVVSSMYSCNGESRSVFSPSS